MIVELVLAATTIVASGTAVVLARRPERVVTVYTPTPEQKAAIAARKPAHPRHEFIHRPPAITDETPHSAIWIGPTGARHIRVGDEWKKL